MMRIVRTHRGDERAVFQKELGRDRIFRLVGRDALSEALPEYHWGRGRPTEAGYWTDFRIETFKGSYDGMFALFVRRGNALIAFVKAPPNETINNTTEQTHDDNTSDDQRLLQGSDRGTIGQGEDVQREEP